MTKIFPNNLLNSDLLLKPSVHIETFFNLKFYHLLRFAIVFVNVAANLITFVLLELK